MEENLQGLGLENIAEGELNDEFKSLIPSLVNEILATGKKGTVSIAIEFAKVADTNTMVTTKFKIGHKLPTREREGIAYIRDGNKLKTEIVKPPKSVNLFEAKFDPVTGEVERKVK